MTVPEHARATVATLLREVSPLTDADLEPYLAAIHVTSYKAGDMFMHAGDAAKYLGFVLDGLFRIFYLTSDGDQLTRRFAPRGRAIGDLTANLMNKPALVSIEALEDSEVAVVEFAKLEALYDRYPAWQRIGRKLAERHSTLLETREYQFLAFAAKERYRLFRAEYPGLEDRVSQANIASYLGISPVSLSRIRSSSNR